MSHIGVRVLVLVAVMSVSLGVGVTQVHAQAAAGSARAAQEEGLTADNSGASTDVISTTDAGATQTQVQDPCTLPENAEKCKAGQVPCGTVSYDEGRGLVTCSKDPKTNNCFLPAGAPAVCTLDNLDAASYGTQNSSSNVNVSEYKPGQGYVSRGGTSNDFAGLDDAFSDQRQQTMDQIVDQVQQNPPEVKVQTLTQYALENNGLISQQEAARRALLYSGPDVNSLNPTPAATPAQLNAYYGEGNWANQYSPYGGPLTRGLLSPTEAANFIDTATPQQWQATFVPQGQGAFAPAPTAQRPALQTFSNAFTLAPQPYSGLTVSAPPNIAGTIISSAQSTVPAQIVTTTGTPPSSFMGSPSAAAGDPSSVLGALLSGMQSPSGGASSSARPALLDTALQQVSTDAGASLWSTFAEEGSTTDGESALNRLQALGTRDGSTVYADQGAPAESLFTLANLEIQNDPGLQRATADTVQRLASGEQLVVPGSGGVYSPPPSSDTPGVIGSTVAELRSVAGTVASVVYDFAQPAVASVRNVWAKIRAVLDAGSDVDVTGIEL